MPAKLAVVGPGRVGTALGRRWAEAGFALLGFLGRRPGSAAGAVAFCGTGRELPGYAALREATVVLLSVSDAELAAVVGRAVEERAPRRCALWLHASGLHDLAVLEPLRACGARTGSLHPLCPIPDARSGYEGLPGKPAVIQGGPRSLRLLAVLARKAGLRPVRVEGGDRGLYHAACALAANGLTALFDQARELLVAACRLEPEQAGALVLALMRAALEACAREGVPRALSGPVQRGDRAVLATHLARLEACSAEAAALYRGLMLRAAAMAARGGSLTAAQAEEVRALLAADRGRGRGGETPGG